MTAPEKTDDGRYIIVGGRRWRATDPELREDVVAALKHHLGVARSTIGRLRDEQARASWRARVQLAKEGLGERGDEWWDLDVEQRRARAADRLAQLVADTPER